MTTFTLFMSPWTTSNVCAIVNRPSSCVRRSSLCSTASISLSPSSFFANFSTQCRAVGYLIDGVLTESALFNLLRSQSEHGEQFDHDFDRDIHHGRRQGDDIGIDPKALEEISDTFEQVYKCVVARADSIGCLRSSDQEICS